MSWEDISFRQDGSVLKQSLQGDDGDGILPLEGCKVTLMVKTVLADGIPVRDGECTVEFVLGNGEVCDALEYACCKMVHSEHVIVRCDVPRMAFDKKLGLSDSLATPIIFEVLMLGFESRPEKGNMTESEKLKFALDRKNVGAQLFKENRVEIAFQRYSAVVNYLNYIDKMFDGEDSRSLAREVKIVCQLNRAACALKLGDPKRAAVCCSSVLAHHPDNVKALFRRASAFIELDRYGDAIQDLEQLSLIDPQNAEGKKLLAKTQQCQLQAEKQLCVKMLSPRRRRQEGAVWPTSSDGASSKAATESPSSPELSPKTSETMVDTSALPIIEGRMVAEELSEISASTDFIQSCLDASQKSEIVTAKDLCSSDEPSVHTWNSSASTEFEPSLNKPQTSAMLTGDNLDSSLEQSETEISHPENVIRGILGEQLAPEISTKFTGNGHSESSKCEAVSHLENVNSGILVEKLAPETSTDFAGKFNGHIESSKCEAVGEETLKVPGEFNKTELGIKDRLNPDEKERQLTPRNRVLASRASRGSEDGPRVDPALTPFAERLARFSKT